MSFVVAVHVRIQISKVQTFCCLLCLSPATDIKPKSNGSSSLSGNADKPLWCNSDNSFKFNFLPDNVPAITEELFLPAQSSEAAQSQISFTGQGTFTFNFQIPPTAPVEDMDTTATPQNPSLVQEEKPSVSQDTVPPEAGVQLKGKKKKKSGKKKPSDDVSHQEPAVAEGNQKGEEAELVIVSDHLLNLS